ncbi:hypothetical protein CDV36_004673 [Fusarium kuroshium]|uniref:Adhesin domain-containing protein n=1 Tax=Fusarium kuroshium TaxID=2010991 RepID=A0A3M2SDM2_9HYPO|nr:hypothetical protein CDV36_004673 [Fusarium kuroshium]
MRATTFGAIWAVLVTPILARGVYLSERDLKALPPVRKDMLQKRADFSEDINFSEIDKDIINVDLPDNKLQVHCNKCEVGGRVDADFNAEILNPPESEFKISFAETKGHLDITVAVGSGAEQVIPLWNTQGIPTDEAQGLALFLELVVSLEGELEATGGFEFTIPEGSWLSVDLKGDIVETSFDGATGKSLEWDLASGSSTLKVSLRLRTELGAGSKLVDLRAAVGVFMNLVELVVNFERDDNDAVCVLEATESFNINAGVYADINIDIGQVTLGPNPTASTTLFAGPTAAQCLESATATGGDVVTQTEASPVVTQTQGGAIATDDCDEAIETVVSGQPQQQPTASSFSTLITSRRVATVTEHVVVTVTEYSEARTTICPEDE